MSQRFLLDEHLRGPLWQAILRFNLRGLDSNLDVVRVGDPPELPLSTDDPSILAWCEREGRILVTHDRRTMSVHLRAHLQSGHHSPGIVVVRANTSVNDVIECLILIAEAEFSAEFRDAIISSRKERECDNILTTNQR